MKPITSQKFNFDSADAQYGSSIINTNVIVSDNGQVVWLSHGIFRSSCDINVEFFPFDIQSCKMKWASWTYDGYQVSSIKLIQFYINSLFHQVTRLRSSSGAIKVNCCFWESNFIKKLSVVRLAVWSFHTRLTFDGCPDSLFVSRSRCVWLTCGRRKRRPTLSECVKNDAGRLDLMTIDSNYTNKGLPSRKHLQTNTWPFCLQIDLVKQTEVGDLSNYQTNGEFDLVGMEVVYHEEYYSCCPEPYPDITYIIKMRRRPLFYVFNLILPCILINGIGKWSLFSPHTRVFLGKPMMITISFRVINGYDHTSVNFNQHLCVCSSAGLLRSGRIRWESDAGHQFTAVHDRLLDDHPWESATHWEDAVNQ